MNTIYTQCEQCHKELDKTIPIENGILCQWCYIMAEDDSSGDYYNTGYEIAVQHGT